MLKVSTRGRYGLRIMMELALRHGSGPVPVRDLAARQSIPSPYVQRLARDLCAAGLARSVRGPSGGFVLAAPPETLTALAVVEALEGPVEPVECVGGAAACDRSGFCATREVWAEAARAVRAALEGHTLARLAVRQREGGAGALTYEI